MCRSWAYTHFMNTALAHLAFVELVRSECSRESWFRDFDTMDRSGWITLLLQAQQMLFSLT
jgi:hypothetical protein